MCVLQPARITPYSSFLAQIIYPDTARVGTLVLFQARLAVVQADYTSQTAAPTGLP